MIINIYRRITILILYWDGNGFGVTSKKELFPVNDAFYLQNYSVASMRDILRNTEEEILAATGLDVTGFMHCLENYGVLHILKKHGNPKTEEKRNQIPVTPQSFGHILDILIAPDKIESVGKNNTSRDVIVYTKFIDGNYYYLAGFFAKNRQ